MKVYIRKPNGEPMRFTVDVTPSWWERRKRSCYAPLAALLVKFPYAVDVTVGLSGCSVVCLMSTDGDFQDEFAKLSDAVEAMGTEFSAVGDSP